MIKRANYFDVLDYLRYQENILQYNHKSIARKWGHLRHLLNWANDVQFEEANKIENQFPQYLQSSRNDGHTGRLSVISMQRACLEARSFFEWCRLHKPARFKRLPQVWIETIRPGRSSSIQSELYERPYYSLDEVRKLVDFSPERLIDERDRAAVAFVFLSGMRVSAFVSLPIRCVDIDRGEINQFPSEGVKTKNSKAAKTFLLPISDLREISLGWYRKVKSEQGKDAYWYAPLSTDGMEWSSLNELGSAESRRMSFSRGLKRLGLQAGVVYKSPHKLRNGHGVFGVKAAKTIEEFKAFSQNMMHESMGITDRLYGRLASNDVSKTIMRFRETSDASQESEELFRQFSEFQKWLQNRK
jgi:integrase